jgi:hypothetical protein
VQTRSIEPAVPTLPDVVHVTIADCDAPYDTAAALVTKDTTRMTGGRAITRKLADLAVKSGRERDETRMERGSKDPHVVDTGKTKDFWPPMSEGLFTMGTRSARRGVKASFLLLTIVSETSPSMPNEIQETEKLLPSVTSASSRGLSTASASSGASVNEPESAVTVSFVTVDISRRSM